MPQYRGGMDRRLAVAVGDARIGPDGKKAVHFIEIAAHDGAVKQRIAERALKVRIVDCERHVEIVPKLRDSLIAERVTTALEQARRGHALDP